MVLAPMISSVGAWWCLGGYSPLPTYGPYDEDITTLDINYTPPLDIQGAITRARAQQLNLVVSRFLRKALYVNPGKNMLPNDYILVSNTGEDQEGYGERPIGGGYQQRCPNQVGGPSIKFDLESKSRPQ